MADVDADDAHEEIEERRGEVMFAMRDGEWEGVVCPEPAVFPDSISKALNALVVEREREHPRKT